MRGRGHVTLGQDSTLLERSGANSFPQSLRTWTGGDDTVLPVSCDSNDSFLSDYLAMTHDDSLSDLFLAYCALESSLMTDDPLTVRVPDSLTDLYHYKVSLHQPDWMTDASLSD